MIRAFWPYLPSAFRVAFRLLAQAGHAAESLGIARSELALLPAVSAFRGILPCESSPARHSAYKLALRDSGQALPGNSSESSAGVSPASSAISFNRHPRLFLARRRSPGFLTGRKRSVQAWITGLWEPCSGARRNFRLRKKSGCPKRAACVGEVLRGGG